jgi:hypothetical protein
MSISTVKGRPPRKTARSKSKLTAPAILRSGAVLQKDLSQLPEQVKRFWVEVEKCRPNDGTWELLDNGQTTPLKLAIALVLWPAKDDVRSFASDRKRAIKAIGRELWSAVQNWKHDRLVQEIEDSAESFERSPSSIDLQATSWSDIAALEVLGHKPRWRMPPGAKDYIRARRQVRSFRRRFESYREYRIGVDQQRRIRSAFRKTEQGGVVPALVEFGRDPDIDRLRKLARRVEAFETMLADAPGEALAAGFFDAGTTAAEMRRQLQCVVRSLVAEAAERHRRADKVIRPWFGIKPGKGRPKAHDLWHVLKELADVFEIVTGKPATANYRAIQEDRQTDYVIFAHEMCERAGRPDFGSSVEGTAPGVLKERRKHRERRSKE